MMTMFFCYVKLLLLFLGNYWISLDFTTVPNMSCSSNITIYGLFQYSIPPLNKHYIPWSHLLHWLQECHDLQWRLRLVLLRIRADALLSLLWRHRHVPTEVGAIVGILCAQGKKLLKSAYHISRQHQLLSFQFFEIFLKRSLRECAREFLDNDLSQQLTLDTTVY